MLEPPQFCCIKVGFKGVYITRTYFHDGICVFFFFVVVLFCFVFVFLFFCFFHRGNLLLIVPFPDLYVISSFHRTISSAV